MIWEAPEAATMSPVRRVAGIVLIFMLVGPPVGGFVFLVGRWIAVALLQTTRASGGWLEAIAYALVGVLASAFAAIAAAPYSYMYGIVPAAVAGLVIGILRLQYGRLNTLIVLFVGGGIGTTSSLVLSRLIGVTNSPINLLALSGFSVTEYLLYAFSCVIATLACWRFARSFPA